MKVLDHARCQILADTLGNAPETVIATHALRSGRCRAYIAGEPDRFAAAIIDAHETPGELLAFGENPEDIWNLAKGILHWSCIEVIRELAQPLADRMQIHTGKPVRQIQDVFYALNRPSPSIGHPAVRLLSQLDADLYARSAPVFGDDPAKARRNLLEGPVAAALIDGMVVAAVEGNVRTAQYANLGAETLPMYRNRGLCTAAASTAAAAVQAMGLIPVWSAGETNLASRRVVEKLGFDEVARWVYLVPQRNESAV